MVLYQYQLLIQKTTWRMKWKFAKGADTLLKRIAPMFN
ncbi:hypothetical protein [Yersinia phage fPS-90]|uniref:Uncharacterized protein n=1 Tax=Yersinia phage fPS-90 TaxID=2052932 RepID=A0A449C3Q0_9CAUD|nr:hypothetical protein KNT67_gp009 [Yersinia phage fPS-90]VEV88854.1 hypothetical protein [Yersinia phage fPS-90]